MRFTSKTNLCCLPMSGDASSAQAAQQAGYQALGSSSAAIAAMLGYEDGEEMSFDELFYVVSRIKTVLANCR
ncbi:carboxyvinyl-carboxyphosphonate phosphorylmutase [Klebsiella pneumoniae]|uniref:Carboxyvinyl-carboxyphosphonate phosphorylmutase n=1 Tax=Klebsiella pneumoniae TaxID=573 RepID=A0A2X3EBI1_KLEPN|nr:carboxyvinyl-carboxyphosphonate phosphorylmutase [Klebsiella pneumoniae]